MRLPSITFLLIACVSVLAAHSGHETATFNHGFSHPFGGLDHLIAMLAVGLLGARFAGHWRWAFPAVFLGGLGLGGLMGAVSIALPGVEMAIAVSVVLFGVMLALAGRLSPWMVLALIAVAGMPHGHAHLSEAGGGSLLGYGLGMLAGSALLHGLGLFTGLACASSAAVRERWQLVAGPAVSLAGCALVVLLAI